MKDSGFMFRIFGACLHVVFECCFPPRRAMCIQQLLESWKQSSWILCPGTWSTPKKCPTNFFVPSWPVVFLPNAHGLHGGKISHRVNARFPMQSPLAQEVPAGGWESPGVRWPVARSCSKISALLSYVSPNGAFWQEPNICLCRQVFDCTIPDSNWCPLLFAWYFGQSGILKTVVDSFETWPWRIWARWVVSVVLWWAYGTKISNSKSPSTGTLPGKERSTHPSDRGATLANPADFWMCMF